MHLRLLPEKGKYKYYEFFLCTEDIHYYAKSNIKTSQ